ncbi:MAG: hypothetical protein KatS3mg101_0437 [Patescibacteria group bacterium]|nr:MAG: hypothetical protein KatS3mg101_0437 [Patescibacteria group bacterium]
MDNLQEITECRIGNPRIVKSNREHTSHLVRIEVAIKNGPLQKELVFHINVRKDERGWHPHNPTLERIKETIKEEGFDPDTFNLIIFKTQVMNAVE